MGHITRFSSALDFAMEWHGDQKYGEHRYDAHLRGVYVRYIEFHERAGESFSPAEAEAIALHDTLEDTACSRELVRNRFGERVEALVWAVTKHEGRNRKEKNELCLPKIPKVPGAVKIKLADTISNVEACWEQQDPKLFMYQREYRFYRETLRVGEPTGAEKLMWDHLDKLLGWYEPKRG